MRMSDASPVCSGWPSIRAVFAALLLSVSMSLTLAGPWSGAVGQAPPAHPDLTVFDVQASVKEAWMGTNVEISSLISNKGGAEARNISVSFYDGSNRIAERTIDVLGPGANQELVVRWSTGDAQIGKHTIRVVVDPKDTISESNETNNEASAKLTVNQNPLITYAIPLLILLAVIGILGYRAYIWLVLRRLRYKQKCKKDAEGKEECIEMEEE